MSIACMCVFSPPFTFVSSLMAVNKFGSTVLFSPSHSSSLVKEILIQKQLLIISQHYGVKKPVKIHSGHLGKDYSECAHNGNSPSMLTHCPVDRVFGKNIILHSQRRFIFLMHLYCFFHHCDMVRSFPSILFLLSRICIIPMDL